LPLLMRPTIAITWGALKGQNMMGASVKTYERRRENMLVYEGQKVGYPTIDLPLELEALDLLFDDYDMEFIHIVAEKEQEQRD